MKLPSSANLGVQRLASAPSEAPAMLAKGQAVAEATQSIDQAFAIHDERKARDYALEQNNNFTIAQGEEEARLRSLTDDGDEYIQGMETFFKKQKDIAISNAKGPRQESAVNRLYDGLEGRYSPAIFKAGQQMNEAKSERLVGDLITAEQKNIYNSPGEYKQSVDVAIAGVNDSDLTESRKADLRRDIKSNLKYTSIIAMADIDAKTAIESLKEDNPSLNAKQLKSLDRYAKSKLKEQNKALLDNSMVAMKSLSENVSISARSGDVVASGNAVNEYSETVDALVGSGVIDASRGSELKRSILREEKSQELLGDLEVVAEDNSVQSAMVMLDNMSSRPPSNFSQDQWDKFRVSAQQSLNRKAARQKSESKSIKSEMDRQKSISRGSLFMDAGIPADPAKSSQDRKDVNAYYEEISPEWDGDLNDLIAQNVDFVDKTGIIPDQLISNMNASMRSGSVDHVITMMETMQRIQEDRPGALRDIPDDARSVALQVSDSMRNGLSSADAIEIARKNTYGVDGTRRKELSMLADEADPTKTFESLVNDRFDPGVFYGDGRLFPGEPDIPPGMYATFKSNFNDFMVKTDGNIEQSENLAFESTVKFWGVTNVGGDRRFMRNPPESFYHVDGFDDVWIEDQLNLDAEALGLVDAVIGIDNKTLRSDSPTYPILAVNDRGFLDDVKDENGRLARFKPDFKKSDVFIDISEAPQKALESAKEKRKRNIERRANVLRRRITSRVGGDLDNKDKIREAVNRMLAVEQIDFIEAKEVLDAFSAGDIKDIPGYDILVERGLIRDDSI
jgi:hypothetical protein